MSTWEGPGHATWDDAAGAYVLGALPPDEATAYEAHLVACPACRAEVEELMPAVEALPASVAPLEPPPALRDRLMTEVRRQAEVLAAAEGRQADRAPARRPAWWAPWRTRWMPAAAGLATLAVGVVVGLLVGGGPESRTVPLTASARVAGAHARLVVHDGEATLAADHLPPPPGNRVYQVWIQPRGGGAVEPTSSLFVPRSDGTATVALPPQAVDSRQVMVSAEPRGGSAQPTTQPVLTGRLPS
jgi:anti-sigma-K factor RskA